MHPHGVIPIQGFLWPAMCDQYMCDMYGFGATTDAAMRVPLLRQVLSWLSAGSAHRDVLRKGLDDGKNLYLLPGGVSEIFTSQPGTHVIIARRAGLMKLALRTGACLVPMYVFGGTDFFDHLATSGGWLGRASRRLRAGFTLFWGQYYLPMPYPAKCCMVMADPVILVPGGGKVENPTQEQIDELLERYLDATRRLFDQYKAQAGFADAKLEIR
mmetsp:Transcript_22835/g.46752  ORF Transcript_22835/g.46752 Transcript_22835/m.46752 type:complete len:214 (-) Transcript_22835:125-766(-)